MSTPRVPQVVHSHRLETSMGVVTVDMYPADNGPETAHHASGQVEVRLLHPAFHGHRKALLPGDYVTLPPAEIIRLLMAQRALQVP